MGRRELERFVPHGVDNLKQKDDAKEQSIMALHNDPVCNMQVNEKTAADKSYYLGETYYFCSRECKHKFDENPQQYHGKQAATQTAKRAKTGAGKKSK